MLTQLQIQAWICIVFIFAFVIAKCVNTTTTTDENVHQCLYLFVERSFVQCIADVFPSAALAPHLHHRRFRDSFMWFWFCLVILSFVRRQSVLYGKEKQKKHTAQICKDNCHSLTKPRTYSKSSGKQKPHQQKPKQSDRKRKQQQPDLTLKLQKTESVRRTANTVRSIDIYHTRETEWSRTICRNERERDEVNGGASKRKWNYANAEEPIFQFQFHCDHLSWFAGFVFIFRSFATRTSTKNGKEWKEM